jgi:hypothetical protein
MEKTTFVSKLAHAPLNIAAGICTVSPISSHFSSLFPLWTVKELQKE